jgi:hypothetical protein
MIVAIAASTASEWRTNFEAASAITKSKIRAVQVMPLGIAAIGTIADFASANETPPASARVAALMLGAASQSAPASNRADA